MKRASSVFYGVVAVVVGAMVYPVVFRAYNHGLGLAAPVVVILVAGLVLGLFSRSWRIALLCSWLIVLIGLVGLLVSTLAPTVGDNSTTASLGGALLVGGLGGAGVGGYFGAKLRARGERVSEKPAVVAEVPITARSTGDLPQTRGAASLMLAQRHSLVVGAAVLVVFGVLVGPGGPGRSESLSKAAWFGAAIAAVIWIALRPVPAFGRLSRLSGRA